MDVIRQGRDWEGEARALLSELGLVATPHQRARNGRLERTVTRAGSREYVGYAHCWRDVVRICERERLGRGTTANFPYPLSASASPSPRAIPIATSPEGESSEEARGPSRK